MDSGVSRIYGANKQKLKTTVSKRVKNNLLRSFTVVLVAVCLQQVPAGEIKNRDADSVKTDSSKLKGEKSVDLDQKIEPSSKTIEVNTAAYPKLAEPNVIRIDIQSLPAAQKDSIAAVPLGGRQQGLGAALPTGPRLYDTLAHHLIQYISLDRDIYKQGEIATLNLTALLPLQNASIKFLYNTYKLYAAGRSAYRTTLAVPMDVDTGKYYMTLKYDEDGQQKNLKLRVKITGGDFAEEDTAELDIHVLTEETLEMLKYEGRYFTRAYGVNTDSMLHDGDFIWPCSGSLTGMYGIARKYNKEMDKWSHKAVDIANAPGTDVVAANNGIVAMVENLEAHGKSVVIAHGQGIHTVYLHLNKINVEKGDTVAKGQVIGELGRTGMCTGPNLHFQIMLNRVATDPRCWIKGGTELGKGEQVKPELIKTE